MAKKSIAAANNHALNGHHDPILDAVVQEFVQPMTKEQAREARGFDKEQIKAVVMTYYAAQRLRIQHGNRMSAYGRGAAAPSSPALLEYLKKNLLLLEKNISKMLEQYCKGDQPLQKLAQWCNLIRGVGPIQTAAIISMVDFHRCCCPEHRNPDKSSFTRRDQIPEHDCPGLKYAGAIWAFGGIPANREWTQGTVRPYSKLFKTILYNVGVGFRKASVNEDDLDMDDDEFAKKVWEAHAKTATANGEQPLDPDSTEFLIKVAEKKERMQERFQACMTGEDALYCRIYRQKYEQYREMNEDGKFREEVKEYIKAKTRAGRPLTDDQKKSWGQGKRQNIGLHMMAGRYAVKIFTSHFHQIGRELIFGDKVTPWVIKHGGHERYIAPPLWPVPGKEVTKSRKK